MGYIYKITNLINQKSYIGLTTKTPEIRYKEHIRAAFNSNDKSYNELLKKAIRKYGIENFIVEEIDKADNEKELKEKEIYWIQYYNTYYLNKNSNGYNMTLGGDNPTHDNKIPIKRVNIMTGEILEHCESIAAAQRQYHRGIENIIQNNATTQIPKGYTWLLENEEYNQNKIYNKFNIICQLNLEGKLINYWLNAEEASKKTNTSVGNLKSCLINDRQQAGGFQWCYYKDLNNKLNKPYKVHTKAKKVGQYDLYNNLIKIWDSATEAAKETGTNLSKISAVCNGKRKTSNGFKWQYI